MHKIHTYERFPLYRDSINCIFFIASLTSDIFYNEDALLLLFKNELNS